MSRYIDADKLLEVLNGFTKFYHLDMLSVGTFIDMVTDMPTADVVEVKHGRWIKDRLCSTSGGTYGVRRCSVCEDYYQDVGYGWNYCPNCGAKMEGEEDGM